MPSLGRVLIVDDEPEVAAMLRDALIELGYSAQTASAGPEALELAPRYRPDLVLLDLMMPGMPGSTVLEQLRILDPGMPVIILTADRDVGTARWLLFKGAFDYVRKPFQLAILERVVATAVVARSGRRQ